MGRPSPANVPRHGDRAVDQLTSEVSRLERGKAPALDGNGRELKVTIGASTTATANHLLKRKLRGWTVIRCIATGPLDGFVDETVSDDKTITLRNGATVGVELTLWVF